MAFYIKRHSNDDGDYDDHEEDRPQYRCVECGEECGVIVTDEGIGRYEYWGATGVDIQIVTESDCCEAPVELIGT